MSNGDITHLEKSVERHDEWLKAIQSDSHEFRIALVKQTIWLKVITAILVIMLTGVHEPIIAKLIAGLAL